MSTKREYPYGRTAPDGVSQIFRSRDYAYLCARIMNRMTGDDCDVIPCGPQYILLRCVNERWERA